MLRIQRALSLTRISPASARSDGGKAAFKEKKELPELKMRTTPYFRSGTKVEQRPTLKMPREPRMTYKADLKKPNSFRITTQGDYANDDYEVEVKTVGDDLRDYMSFNSAWDSNGPAFISRTAIARRSDGPSSNIDAVSMAMTFARTEQIRNLEGIAPKAGHGQRFIERRTDQRRRMAHMEAKRMLLDEVERKKVSLVRNYNHHGYHHPLQTRKSKPSSMKAKFDRMADMEVGPPPTRANFKAKATERLDQKDIDELLDLL